MSGLTKPELAIILYLQSGEKVQDYTKKDLLLLIQGREFPQSVFEEYQNYSTNPEELLAFDEESLRYYLQIKYKRTFPFAISLFTGKKELLRKTILWWFENFTDFNPTSIRLPSIEQLNSSQRRIIDNIQTHVRNKTMLQIVNAGPGTGKTTAANALAYHLREEGVLLVSYTNESIRENYKRFFEYPEGKKSSGLKKYTNSLINLITVDSLAAKILGDSSDTSFDETVQVASIRIDPYKFVHPTRIRTYNHIVVDECQDIDDLRGNFLLTFCRMIGVKTLTLCGDPRQKIRENCGKWYSDLWESKFNFSRNGHEPAGFFPIHHIGFEESYRFESQQLVDLTNSISSRRPGLHVELQCSKSFLTKDHPISIIGISRLNEILDRLLIPGETACIIGPSIDADNKTTNVGRKIAALFRSKGKNLVFRTDGAFQPDAIPFLTIHSAKGREFDTVFIFGMNNYPANFSMIPHDEALSLIFVAHSRAKRRIFYIDGKESSTFELPLTVEPKFVDTKVYEGSIQASSQDYDSLNTNQMRHFSVSSLVEEHSFIRFLEENRYSVFLEGDPMKVPDWVVVPRPTGLLNSEQWGFLTGFDLQSQLVGYSHMFEFYFGDILNDNYVVISEDQIISMIYSGKIINNRLVLDNKLVVSSCISQEHIGILKNAKDKYSPGIIIWAYYLIYRSDRTLDLQQLCIEFPEEQYLISSEIITGILRHDRASAEVPLTDLDHKVLHGRVDYMDAELNVYEFKCSYKSSKEYKSLLQVWLYHVLTYNPEGSAYLLDCKNGVLTQVKSNESIFRWRYILRSYFILRHHVDLVTARRNYDLSYRPVEQIPEVTLRDNVYFVDTEFFGKDIFEIALVNLTDPFRSIVDLVKPESLEGMMFALDWLPGTEVEMYRSSMNRVKTKFNIGTAKCNEDPILGYYIAPTDVDWCRRSEVQKIDLSFYGRPKAEQMGGFTGGVKGPKLGELYTLLAPFPLEYQNHLRAHTALADALMLYELVRLGIIKI